LRVAVVLLLTFLVCDAHQDIHGHRRRVTEHVLDMARELETREKQGKGSGGSSKKMATQIPMLDLATNREYITYGTKPDEVWDDDELTERFPALDEQPSWYEGLGLESCLDSTQSKEAGVSAIRRTDSARLSPEVYSAISDGHQLFGNARKAGIVCTESEVLFNTDDQTLAPRVWPELASVAVGYEATLQSIAADGDPQLAFSVIEHGMAEADDDGESVNYGFIAMDTSAPGYTLSQLILKHNNPGGKGDILALPREMLVKLIEYAHQSYRTLLRRGVSHNNFGCDHIFVRFDAETDVPDGVLFMDFRGATLVQTPVPEEMIAVIDFSGCDSSYLRK